MKKIYTYILAVLFVALSSANTVKADATYKITQDGQADVTGTFTTFKDFMDVLNAHELGTRDHRVTATITGATITDSGRPKHSGWRPGFLYYSDTFAYTDLIFENCTLTPSRDPGFTFEPSRYPGNKLIFNNCNFPGTYSIYGVNGGLDTNNHPYDCEFNNCDINKLGSGATWFGDVTIVGGKLLDANFSCGFITDNADNRFKNSFGDPSTLTVKNVIFKGTEAGNRGVYTNNFKNYVYKKAGSDNHLYSIKTNGWQNDYKSHPERFKHTLVGSTGDIEFSVDGEEYTGFYLLTGYVVKYDANGGEGTVVDPKYYTPGDKATILANGFTKSGNAFTGWNTQADGTGTSYAEGDIVEIPFYVLQLYAQWAEGSLNAVKVKITGLDESDSAIFALYLNGSTLLNVINLTGNVASKTVTSEWFTPGATCTVAPYGNWSWKYDVVLSKKSTELSDKGLIDVYEYKATKKDNITTKNGESYKANKLIRSNGGYSQDEVITGD